MVASREPFCKGLLFFSLFVKKVLLMRLWEEADLVQDHWKCLQSGSITGPLLCALSLSLQLKGSVLCSFQYKHMCTRHLKYLLGTRNSACSSPETSPMDYCDLQNFQKRPNYIVLNSVLLCIYEFNDFLCSGNSAPFS